MPTTVRMTNPSKAVARYVATEVESLRRDAARYRWLRKHYGCVNFEPEDHDGMDLVFCVPQGEVSADCDKTLDGLMNGANAVLSRAAENPDTAME